MNTIVEKKINDILHYGIIRAEHWFNVELTEMSMVHPDDLIVCKWSEVNDGEKNQIEDLTTIAICRTYDDALLLYNKYLNMSYPNYNLVVK